MIERDLFGARRGEYAVPKDPYTNRCASCKAQIIWTRTNEGKAIPLSVATIEERDGVRYALTHFADCPEAREWSRKGKQS